MTISPISAISAGGLSQNVVTASDSNQLKQALQTLQSTLALGDLTSAQSAFQTLQTVPEFGDEYGKQLVEHFSALDRYGRPRQCIERGRCLDCAIGFCHGSEQSENYRAAVAGK